MLLQLDLTGRIWLKLLRLDLKSMQEADFKELLMNHYTFLKRPVFVTDKEIFIGCQSGLRGHVAYRILQAHGFRTYNLSGGFITWQAVTESISK